MSLWTGPEKREAETGVITRVEAEAAFNTERDHRGAAAERRRSVRMRRALKPWGRVPLLRHRFGLKRSVSGFLSFLLLKTLRGRRSIEHGAGNPGRRNGDGSVREGGQCGPGLAKPVRGAVLRLHPADLHAAGLRRFPGQPVPHAGGGGGGVCEAAEERSVGSESPPDPDQGPREYPQTAAGPGPAVQEAVGEDGGAAAQSLLLHTAQCAAAPGPEPREVPPRPAGSAQA